jgi:peptide chain release factor subunit 3
MDSENWSYDRFTAIKKDLSIFLDKTGFDVANNVSWIPISGFHDININKRIPKEVCPWYTGGTLFEILDNVEIPERDKDGPVRLPILDHFED